MAKAYVFLATGFEDIEALIPVDIWRRGGIEVTTVSVTGQNVVTSAHGVNIEADTCFEQCDLTDADLLFLPGGMPGATNLYQCKPLCEALCKQAEEGQLVAAICASPAVVLAAIGLLDGKKATCYPGFEGSMTNTHYTADLVTIDGNITTGEGPAAAFPFAYELLAQLKGVDVADAIAEGMRYKHLMG